ncbi:mediator of RNA polymerase II transcription subunit 1, partial [Brachionus plicatilis]
TAQSNRMDQCNKDLSKKPINWTDLEKQLPHVQTRIGAASASGIPSHSISINKLLVKQCTDLLIKHIKKLNQAQVIDQLENLAQSCSLLIYKTPSEEDPNTLNAFLTTDDFYFEVAIALSGEITDAKFSIFSEPATSSVLLKNIFCSWNWDLLSKHIEGVKCNFILSDPDPQIRSTGFKAIQCLEKDLSQLYQIELRFYEKVNGTKPSYYALNQQPNYTDKLINQTPIGVFKKSELGQPLRLYYYLSPLDLIQHHQNLNAKFKKKIDSTHNTISNLLSPDELFSYELGSYLSVSLVQTSKTHKLVDSNLLVLTENDDERTIFEYLNPYVNQNFNIEQ